jgi:hypothetical protein
MKKINLDEIEIALKDFFPDVPSASKTTSICVTKKPVEKKKLDSSKIGTEPFDQYTGKISDTPENPEFAVGQLNCEGGSSITEPNAGITSDMVSRENGKKKTRWTINAYPDNEDKVTPTL